MENNSDIYDLLNNLDSAIYNGFTIFAQFEIIKHSEIENLLKKIEQNMPEEIVKAKAQLIRSDNEYIYKSIDEIRMILERAFKIFTDYVFINSNEIQRIIDYIYAKLPVELQEARAILKS